MRKTDTLPLVVGIPGTQMYAGTLTDFAVAGGFEAPEGGYYDVPASGGVEALTETFQEITTQLVMDCEIPLDEVPPNLYYPATQEEVDLLLENGITPTDRRYVHLSKTFEDAFNAGVHRTEDPQIIEIDAAAAMLADVYIGQAGPTVFVTRGVPPDFITPAEEPEGFVPPEPPEQLAPRRRTIRELDE